MKVDCENVILKTAVATCLGYMEHRSADDQEQLTARLNRARLMERLFVYTRHPDARQRINMLRENELQCAARLVARLRLN